MCDRLVPRHFQTPEPYGLYHSPDVSTEILAAGIAGKLPRFDAPCTCHNPLHRFRPAADGWFRDDIALKVGEQVFIWPSTPAR